MARLFADGYIQVESPAITAYPFAMCCWAKIENITTQHWVMWVGDKDVASFGTYLGFAGTLVGDPINAFSHDYGGASGAALSTSGYSVDTWTHACGVFATTSNRVAFLNGANRGTNFDSVGAIANHDRTAIGTARDSSPSGDTNGAIAEAAFWDLSTWPGATDADKSLEFQRVAVPALGARFSPLFFPRGLVAYWPLGGPYSANDGDHDIVGAFSMTSSSNATVADHPPGMIYPSRVMGQFISAPTVGFVPSRVIGRGILQGVYG